MEKSGVIVDTSLKKPTLEPGLYIVATPIGNKMEFSQRAVHILGSVDLVLCEDTRHSHTLFSDFGINTRRKSCHRFNEKKTIDEILGFLKQGKLIALVSDAGAPAVADPGNRMVSACHEAGIHVYSVGGPSAVINSAMVSGMVESGFIFAGFPPAKANARIIWLQHRLDSSLPLIIFESPHRLINCLQDIQSLWGEKHIICLTRELTKKFETIKRGEVKKILAWICEEKVRQKGEFTLIISPLEASMRDKLEINDLAKLFIKQKIRNNSASAIMAKITGLSKNECYKALLACRED